MIFKTLIITIFISLFCFTTIFAQTKIAVIPFAADGISVQQALILTDKLRDELIRSGKYINVLSKDVENRTIRQILSEEDSLNLHWIVNPRLVELAQLVGIEQIIGGKVKLTGKTYTFFIRVKDMRTGLIVKNEQHYYKGSFDKLLKKGIQKIVSDFTQTKIKKPKYLFISPGAGLFLTEKWKKSTFGGSIAYGGKSWGRIGLDFRVIGADLSENISLFYETPALWIFFFQTGIGFISERKEDFSILDFYNAPVADDIKTTLHSVSLKLGIGFEIPFSKRLRFRPSIKSDLLYTEWEYKTGEKESGILYSISPAIDLCFIINLKQRK